MKSQAPFWDNIAEKYARDVIRDLPAYEYTLERTRSYLKSEDTILEIGCGTGSTALLLADSVAQYHGTDISKNMIAIARRKVAKEDLSNLAFETQGVLDGLMAHDGLDAVLSFNLLHLIDDIPSALKAAHDAIRPGGLLITKTPCLRSASFKFQVMFKAIPIAQFFGKAPEVQFFTIPEFDKMVETAGFDIIESGNHPANPPNRYIVARKR